MSSQRFEFESEAWYRAVAEGRVRAGSDRRDQPGGRDIYPARVAPAAVTVRETIVTAEERVELRHSWSARLGWRSGAAARP